jgi:hypothetical protein
MSARQSSTLPVFLGQNLSNLLPPICARGSRQVLRPQIKLNMATK